MEVDSKEAEDFIPKEEEKKQDSATIEKRLHFKWGNRFQSKKRKGPPTVSWMIFLQTKTSVTYIQYILVSECTCKMISLKGSRKATKAGRLVEEITAIPQYTPTSQHGWVNLI